MILSPAGTPRGGASGGLRGTSPGWHLEEARPSGTHPLLEGTPGSVLVFVGLGCREGSPQPLGPQQGSFPAGPLHHVCTGHCQASSRGPRAVPCAWPVRGLGRVWARDMEVSRGDMGLSLPELLTAWPSDGVGGGSCSRRRWLRWGEWPSRGVHRPPPVCCPGSGAHPRTPHAPIASHLACDPHVQLPSPAPACGICGWALGGGWVRGGSPTRGAPLPAGRGGGFLDTRSVCSLVLDFPPLGQIKA